MPRVRFTRQNDIFIPSQGEGGFLNVNRPSGMTTIHDDDFDRVVDTSSQANLVTDMENAGWDSIAPYNPPRISSPLISSIAGMPASPSRGTTNKRVLRQFQQGSTPGGSMRAQKDFGINASKVYIYYCVGWEDGYEHNGTSEKMGHLNFEVDEQIWQWWEGNETLMDQPGVTTVGSSSPDHAGANQLPFVGAPGSNTFQGAQEPAGLTWMEWEILIERDVTRLRWWRDGVLHADHPNATYPNGLFNFDIDDTWGGNKTKSGAEGRLTDRILIAIS